MVMNFGLDLRPTSQVVKTDDELQAELDQQMAALSRQRQAAETQRASAAGNLGQAWLAQGRGMGYDLPDSYADLATRALNNPLRGSRGLAESVFAPQFTSAVQTGINGLGRMERQIAGLDDQLRAAPAANQALLDQRAASREMQGAAYQTETLGGGAQGGVLPGIAQQGTLDPTQGASWGTPWMQPGFGNPGSLGGLGGFGGAKATQSGNGGWGGVFGNRNPWATA